MNDVQAAAVFLERDRALHVNLLEVLRRGSGEVSYAGPDGVLLYDRGCGGWMMAAAPGRAAELLAAVPADCDTFVGHDMAYFEAARARLGLPLYQVCYSAVYLGREKLPIPDFGGELRLMGPEWAPWIYARYSHPFGGLAYIEGALARGMLGAFVDGAAEPAGFVGFHGEGSIGMLEVLPAYRRRGLGEVLQRAAVGLALDRGAIPFGQIIEDNDASLALQKKVGMTLSEGKMFWLMEE